MPQKQRVTPGISYCSSGSLIADAGEEIAKNSIVYITATGGGGRPTVKKAGATAASAGSNAQLFVAVHYSPNGGRIEVHPGPYIVTSVQTTGGANGIIYLSDTAGATDTSAGTVERMVGNQIGANSTTGSWVFNNYAPTAIVSA